MQCGLGGIYAGGDGSISESQLGNLLRSGVKLPGLGLLENHPAHGCGAASADALGLMRDADQLGQRHIVLQLVSDGNHVDLLCATAKGGHQAGEHLAMQRLDKVLGPQKVGHGVQAA